MLSHRRIALVLSLASMAASGRVTAADDPDSSEARQAADRETPTASDPVPEYVPPVAPDNVVPQKVGRTAIYGIFGFGTPVGAIGIEAVHRFGSILEIAVGAGEGWSANGSQSSPSLGHVLQWSVMPRVHVGHDDHNALTLGLGISGGQYGGIQAFGTGPGCYSDGYPCGGYPTRYVLWGNIEAGGEHWRGRVALRYFIGYALGKTLSPGGGSEFSSLGFPYLGLGLGFAF